MKSLYCSIVKNAGGVVNCARLTFWRVRDTIRIEKTERQERKMQMRRMLGIQPGLTAIIGGGGKTTLLYALARELSQTARVIVCTTTHILPPEHLPCLTDGTETEIRRTLKKTKCVCVGTRTQEGKFTAPELAFEKLLPMADYILAEADGSKHLPLKAHAAHEPVIPPEANQTILVLGASGFGKPIAAAAHRPALYAEKLGVTQDTIVTPELAARLINLEGFHTRVLVNQAQTQRELALARELAAYLHCPVAAGELLKEKMICLC